MTGREFLVLAEGLAAMGGSAECRSAISRAYYGAFHAALNLLVRAGVVLPPGPEAHQKLRFCLLQSGVPSGKEAGEKIESLRRERNKDDYDLHHTSCERPTFVKRQVIVAKEIAACVDQCAAEPVWSDFRQKVREYAEKVLRIELASDGER